MKPIKQYPLRKIAECELARIFGDLDEGVRNDLAISLVRQWLANDGYAGLVTPTHRLWFHMVAREDGNLDVGCGEEKRNLARELARKWQVDEDEVRDVIHDLNLCQTAVCQTADGRTIRLWIEPKEGTVHSEEQQEE
jgi:hypothetical protein